MKKLITGILGFCLLLAAAGCSHGTAAQASSEAPGLAAASTEASTEAEKETEPEEQDYYQELITAVKECLVNQQAVPEDYDFSTSLLTAGSYGTPGYLTEDIDGDGIDELIFGVNGYEPNETWDGIVYDIYTISDGKLVHVLDGWDRNRYYFCENGMLANEGSSGAGNSSYAYFTYEKTGLQLVEAVIYDGMKDAQNPWFYSTESESDTENAEPISEEKAMEIRGKYTYEAPDFTPFVE